MKTLTITNFGGPLTRRNTGDINSGFAKFEPSWGYDPFSKPGSLTWMEQPTSILTSALNGTNGTIIAMKQRSTGSVLSVYAMDGAGQLRTIRVNNVNSQTADVDSSSIVGTIANVAFAPDYTRGTGMVFYGNTERIYYGDGNIGIARINFDGSSPSSIISTSSVTASVPRPMTVFQGKIYFGNGNNIGEIDSTETITTGAKLNPALPVGVVVRDLDITPDGNYLQMITSNNDNNEGYMDINTTLVAGIDSNKFLWNGVDTAATAVEKFGGTFLTANNPFADKNYTFGYEQGGAVIYLGSEKKVSLPKTLAPHPTAVFSLGNMNHFMVPEREEPSGVFRAASYGYGKYDDETPAGLFRFLRVSAVSSAREIRSVPGYIPVSNLLYFPTYYDYAGEIAGSGKTYFTTVESSIVSADIRISHLWRHRAVPTGVGSIVAGTYETQTQLFSKRVAIKEVRLYTDPLVADNSFEIELIGSGGSVLAGSSQNFTVGTNVTANDDLVRYNPASPPTYSVGVRITNASVTGTRNWTARKMELDFVEAGV